MTLLHRLSTTIREPDTIKAQPTAREEMSAWQAYFKDHVLKTSQQPETTMHFLFAFNDD